MVAATETKPVTPQGTIAIIYRSEGEATRKDPMLCGIPIVSEEFSPDEQKMKPTIKYVNLKPGSNFVEAADWEAAKTHPLVASRINTGLILEHKPQVDKNAIASGTINDFSVDVAKALIDNTYDADLLREWQRIYKRTDGAEVLNYLSRRIKDLENGQG